MAWRNIRLNTNWSTAGQCDITDFSILSMNSWPSDKSPYIQYPSSTYNDFHNSTFFGDTTNYANGVIQSGRSCVLQIYMNGSYLTSYGNEFLTNDYTWGYVAAVDDENQKGFFALVIRYQNNTSFGWWAGSVPPLPNNSLRNTYYTLLTDNELEVTVTAPGGGATHIAKVTGHLSALSNNLSDILIVAGGGGGGMIIDSVAYDGADAGGISGSGTNSANQSTGYAFGQGESGTGVSGGGGGFYGGYKGGGSSPSPVPPEYESYIDVINGSGFWWKDYPNKNYYNANQAGMAIYPPTLLSWISNYDDYSYNFTPTASRTQYCNVSNIQNVYITSNNDVYSVNHVISGSQQAFLYDNNPGWLGNVYTNQTFATMYTGQNPDGTTLSTSGTLAQVLSWMSYRFRNVNIYVDNVCWSKVN